MKTFNVTTLPKWAQDFIEKLQRQRDVAVNALNEHLDDRTESPFYYDDLYCTGEDNGSPANKRTYVQATGMSIDHAGIGVDIILREGQIDISWGDPHRSCRDVSMIPAAHQSIRLMTKEHMK